MGDLGAMPVAIEGRGWMGSPAASLEGGDPGMQRGLLWG